MHGLVPLGANNGSVASNPVTQMQVYDPGLFVQLALEPHGGDCTHSSMSDKIFCTGF